MGFILLSIGSAVGLDNIWRFPYIVGPNGGGAFLIPCLLAVFLCGLPLMVLEFAVGRQFKTSVVATFSTIKKRFRFAVFFLVFVIGMILSYYLVITNWVLTYFLFFILGLTIPFSAFTISYHPLLFFLMSGIMGFVVVRARVSRGIEKFSKFLVAVLFGMLCVLLFFPFAARGDAGNRILFYSRLLKTV